MVEIRTIANQLNKDDDYVMKLCEQRQIEVQYDSQGCWIYDDQAKELLDTELKTPSRYNFRGIECTDMQRYMIGDKAMQTFWIGNIVKYLYRRQNVGDLKKAAVYLDMLIKEVERSGDIY